MTTPALHLLNTLFGYPAFRHQQEAIVDTLIRGEDALVLMPTGGGKSLCYQIPALIRDGCGVVISPLIALMQDQVDALTQLGVRASFLNSSLSAEAARATEQALLQGQLDLLYIAPERLVQPRTLQLLAQSRIGLFAIDEAHCVSQWGHDFRSDYLQLSLLAEHFPQIPRIALTATADQRTRAEIIARLNLQHARQFVSGFDRPNIQYRIGQKQNARQQLLEFIRQEHPGDAGIIYCLSRRKTEEVAQWLNQQGVAALPYHAGLPTEVRADHQRRFLREDGLIVVATIAFGMGIDKPDVRFVAHLDLPKSIESYYQETGRAGRDGQPATAWMSYDLGDVVKLKQMLSGSAGSAQHKHIEQQRLDAMLGLCELTTCRRQVLLRYFGEEHAPCGNCDTCLNPPQTWDGTEAARMALSCVHRSGQRFGAGHLVDILLGKSNDKVNQYGHQHLSTFGIGKGLTVQQWRSVFRQLVARGLLDVDMEAFGALRLNESCRPLLRGETQLLLRQDEVVRSSAGQRRQKPAIKVADEALWEALRQCRKQLADAQGVPPYVIFHDATLMEMVQYKPRDEQALLFINGVGKGKLERYAAAFLAVIASHCDATESTADSRSGTHNNNHNSNHNSNHNNSDSESDTLAATEMLLRARMDVEQIAAQRQLSADTIYRHIATLLQERRIAWHDAFDLPAAELELIQEQLLAHQAEQESYRLKPVFEALDGVYPFGLLRCVRAAMLTGRLR